MGLHKPCTLISSVHLSAWEGRREELLIAHVLKEAVQSCGVQRKGNEGEWPSSSLFKTNSKLQSLQSLLLRDFPPSVSPLFRHRTLHCPLRSMSTLLLSSHPSVSSAQQNTSLLPVLWSGPAATSQQCRRTELCHSCHPRVTFTPDSCPGAMS